MTDASPERRDYIERVKRDLARQAQEEDQRGEALTAQLGHRLTMYAQGVYERIERYRHGGVTGIEFMLGYGFDITNPTTNRVYSGAVGGIGLTMLILHAGFSLGAMAQQDGLLGVYLSVSASVLWRRGGPSVEGKRFGASTSRFASLRDRHRRRAGGLGVRWRDRSAEPAR